MKTKIRSYSDNATDFYTRKIPEGGWNYIFWLVNLIASVLKKDEHHYPQVVLQEHKYTEKAKREIRYFNGNLKISSDDSGEK